MESSAPSFTARRAPIEPEADAGRVTAPQAATSELKLAVNGVMITAASRAALISVDDGRAAVFVEGQQIIDGVVLYAVNPDRIVVKRGDELVRLSLRGAQSAGGAMSGLAAAGAEPVSTESPPAETEQGRRRVDRD